MIITARKSNETLLSFLRPSAEREGSQPRVILLGCSECATLCKTGGEEQLEEARSFLASEGIETLSSLVLEPACNAQKVKLAFTRTLSPWVTRRPDEGGSFSVVCFSCGDGVQTVAGVASQLGLTVPVYPGTDTLFLGEVVRAGDYVEQCRACGHCELGWTGGICPFTHCAKGLLNGPCGGAKGRSCEVNKDAECAWLRIYDRLEALGMLDNLLEIRPPRDNSLSPRKHSIRQSRLGSPDLPEVRA
ncbi:MAG: methylenetetrahydrofolate reductase C-terminal domain-containing protein [Synergistaceae bacterium]|nr:methylenetetrahydrofolate reductase C-terminal domain-containing protein [Synergistaceae bacterium]